LRADFHSRKLDRAAVNSPQQPVTELYAIHKLACDFCQAILLRIDQHGSGEAMNNPCFVSWWTVIRIGAKFDAEKIFFGSIIFLNNGFRHQPHELFELELIFVLSLL